jgi:Fic family protein
MAENRLKRIDELKARIDQFRPLDKSLLKQIREYFRIGLTYSSNALEGNSLTETETKVVIEDGITIGGKSIKDHYEAIGHSEAYDLLYNIAKKKEITEKHIKDLHRVFFFRIDPKNAGKYRKQRVLITGTEFLPPLPDKVPALMESLSNEIPSLRKAHHPVRFAAFLHRELVTIHPFMDGNGRTARLLMNLALLQDGYPIAIIPPILRAQYLDALRKSQSTPRDDRPFFDFIDSVCYETAKEYLRLLEG